VNDKSELAQKKGEGGESVDARMVGRKVALFVSFAALRREEGKGVRWRRT
jgi:hypothetical protein